MPTHEQLLKYGDKIRKWDRERKRKLSALGYKGGHRNPATYLKHVEHAKQWNKAHRAVGIESSRKYRERIKAVTGGCGEFHRYLFQLMGGAKGYEKSKLFQLQRVQAKLRGERRTLRERRRRYGDAKVSRPLDL